MAGGVVKLPSDDSLLTYLWEIKMVKETLITHESVFMTTQSPYVMVLSRAVLLSIFLTAE